MVAVINNQGGFYRTEVYVHEAKMSGGIINTCVNKSEYETTVYGVDVYLGFMQLEGLDSKTAHRIVADRNTNGEYQSLEDFINRIPIGIGIQILIFIGAFRFTTKTKKSIARHRPLDTSELQTREPELNVASRTS
jgi:DNA polymerase-3 subunit alpha/error-prone DNA polymerase